jgi:DNA-binding PadR family transcriptional regulator
MNTGKKAIIPKLSQGTLSSLLNTLARWDLIQEVLGPENRRKEKYYRITPNGELALQLAEIKSREG